MKVAGLNSNDDWRFGRGRATYIKDSDAVAQNVVTRIREFKEDWYADVNKGIDWLTLLGTRNTRKQIENEIRRVVLQTSGVASLDNLEIISNTSARRATIRLTYTDIYSATFDREIGVGE